MAVNRFNFWEWVQHAGPGPCYWQYHADSRCLNLTLRRVSRHAVLSQSMMFSVPSMLRTGEWRSVIAGYLRRLRRDLRRLEPTGKFTDLSRLPHGVVTDVSVSPQ